MPQVAATGHHAFAPTEDTPFPRPVGGHPDLGRVRIGPGVIRHSTTGTKGACFTASVEIEGRGDGLRSPAATRRDDNELERMFEPARGGPLPAR